MSFSFTLDLPMRGREFIAAAKSPANVAGIHRADWRDLHSWCVAHGLTTLPAAPETVALCRAERADVLKPPILTRTLAAIDEGAQGRSNDR